MTITKTAIEGLLILEPRVFKDDRGLFFESFNEKLFNEAAGPIHFIQDNQSVSKKGVLRGLHFQNNPHAQGKLVRVAQGAVIDVAVDIRKESPTYGQHVAVELTAENNKQFWIPEGFAHGFVALEDNTIFCYKCTDYYAPDCEGSLLWNDPDLNIDWGIENPLVSEKDKVATKFTIFASSF
ncbi:MAG: dTDP-4-dehydrorhamnose 3,5-epimerase [Crocinitomicaceae bacterium]|nr:dTDP-4-dehydrorhamnose 3,5-epimerase [Crocinitomicaceae bacterium]